MTSIQIQTILYGNSNDSVAAAVEAISNALSNEARKGLRAIGQSVIKIGDASESRLFSDEEITELNLRYMETLKIEYRFFGENTGTAKGQNLLAAGCEAEYIMIMNPDVIVSPFFFGAMLAPYDGSDGSVGLVEARQTPIEHPKYYNLETGETGWASTAAVIFPTKVYEEVGGFDQDTFFMYCDDVDFSWRIRLAGKKIIYRPDAQAFHPKRLSIGAAWMPTNAEVYYSAEAALLMAYKWSNDERWQFLLKQYEHSGIESCRNAAAAFRERRKKGMLPEQIDPGHKVAEFIGDFYTNHRFSM